MAKIYQPQDKEERFTCIPNSLIRNPEISARAKAVYAYLRSQKDGRSETQDMIAANVGIKRRALSSALKELEEWGYITVRKPRLTNGQWPEPHYLLNFKPTTGKKLPLVTTSVNANAIPTGGKKLPLAPTSGNTETTTGKKMPLAPTSTNTTKPQVNTTTHHRQKNATGNDQHKHPQNRRSEPLAKNCHHKKTKKTKNTKTPIVPFEKPQPLPHRWQPHNDTLRKIATDPQTTGIDLFTEITTFTTYHQHHGTTAKDWESYFYGWCLNKATNPPPTDQPPHTPRGYNPSDWT